MARLYKLPLTFYLKHSIFEVEMIKTFKYRIYPTKSQRKQMNAVLKECRWMYNHLLEQRKNAWEQEQKTLTCFGQQKQYRELKEERPSLKDVYSQALQNVAVRLDLAMQAFFRRVKRGEKPGYPRFRGYHRYDSFTFPQVPNGCKLTDDGFLALSKIGNVKMVMHRPIEGKPKYATIRRSSTGKWYVTFSCEWEPTALPENPNQIGIDVGVKTFAAMSDGTKIDNPKFFKTEQKTLARAQRKLAKQTKGTKERKRARKIVARVYERLSWRRENFSHQNSRQIVNNHGFVAVEDLSIRDMLQKGHRCLNRSIADVAWRQFLSLLSCKAEWAGRTFVAVNPAWTSQICSSCGHQEKLALSDRTFLCPCCGLSLDRDINAAKNIYALGLQCVGGNSVEAPAFRHGE